MQADRRAEPRFGREALDVVDLYRDPDAPVPGDYTVVRLAAPIAGLLPADAPAWQAAHPIEWGPARYRTRFLACWDHDALHVRWDAVDDRPWHTMTRRDEHIWEEEVVEIFLDPLRSGRNYAELEISPVNSVCDLRVETPGPPLKATTEWDWTGMRSTVVPLGDGHAGGTGWTALARLPFAALATLSPETARATRPAPGATWRFNVFRIKRPGGPERPHEGAVFAAWSPPSGGTFHDPAAFRPFVFGA